MKKADEQCLEVPPEALSAKRLLGAIRKAKVSHLIVVPDTYQKTFLSEVADASDIATIYACTEDEALGINAGLYASGHRPMLSVQNNGIYACINTLRGIALDASVPTIMLIGQYGYRAEQRMEDSPSRMVRLLEPTLQTWEVPIKRLWRDSDIDSIPTVYEQAMANGGPSALIIPIPTVE